MENAVTNYRGLRKTQMEAHAEMVDEGHEIESSLQSPIFTFTAGRGRMADFVG